jgi:oxygen-independent coproporphyrinogen-3 oxidase
VAGVNRLSLGVQSFHDDELRLLGRIHTVAEAMTSFRAARRAGFHNVSLDLIFGLPRQSPDRWHATLTQALALEPEHLSLYSLTVEDGTPLADSIARGDLPPPDDDLAADMYELAEEMLEAAGYLHYEISNWAKAGASGSQGATHSLPSVCRHNLAYWRNEAYLGLGAGAHSSWREHRWYNLPWPQDYVARMAEGGVGEAPWESPVAIQVEAINGPLAMGETMMLGLRLLKEGVPLARFATRFGRSLLDVYADELTSLQAEGLVERLSDRVRLTRRGWLLGNQVFGRFLPDG